MNCSIVNDFICRANNENALEVDFGAFDYSTRRLTLSSCIGNGVDFVSKFMASKTGGDTCSKKKKTGGDLEHAKPLLDYLLALNHQGEVCKIQIK